MRLGQWIRWIYVAIAAGGLITPVAVAILMFVGRRFGAALPDPETGKTLAIDITGRYGPQTIVYVTHVYGVTFNLVRDVFVAWVAITASGLIFLAAKNGFRKPPRSSPEKSEATKRRHHP
ncbi:MAG TPA: hypothetical protein VGG27_13120 [Magnetospirillaceae bacterium]|jgi:hypothetical protein